MRLTRKLKICLALLLILSFTSTALSSPGKYVQLKKDQQIPWNGWCFDERAVADLIVDKDVQKQNERIFRMLGPSWLCLSNIAVKTR